MSSITSSTKSDSSVSPYNQSFVFSPRAYGRLLSQVRRYGMRSAPRGIETAELINASLTLRNPLDRIITDRGRRMNIAFGIAEWVSFMTGIEDITFFTRFIKDYARFSSDGFTLDGNYGSRIVFNELQAGEVVKRYQYEAVIDELENDPNSRRAVMSIYVGNDLYGYGGKNTPCTLNLQFLIRNGRLDCLVRMRSSDVVKGLTYDMFVFTMVQEYIARRLDIPLGYYIHTAGSLHMYQSDFGLQNALTGHRWPKMMRSMPALGLYEISILEEASLLLGDTVEFFKYLIGLPNSKESSYLKDLLLVMKAFIDRNDDKKIAKDSFMTIEDPTLRYVLRPWLVASGALPPSRRVANPKAI